MNTVVVTPSVSYIDVTDNDGGFVTIEVSIVKTVELVTSGPQGPPGISIPISSNNPVTGSVVYYDQDIQIFRVDSDHTLETLTDGGNF
jgi:hypothetical protein